MENHTISPYSIKVKKKSRREGDPTDFPSDKLFTLIKQFLSKHADYSVVEASKGYFKVSDIASDNKTNVISCWFEYGNYGRVAEIIDTDTGETVFTKKPENAVVDKYFIYVDLSLGADMGLVAFHSIGNKGVKSVFNDAFRGFFIAKDETDGFALEINPLTYKSGFDQWANAVCKEIRLKEYKKRDDLADAIKGLGWDDDDYTYTLSMKPKRTTAQLLLSGMVSKNTQENRLIEMLDGFSQEIDIVVHNRDGRKRTHKFDRDEQNFYKIPLPDDAELVEGNPTKRCMLNFCCTELKSIKDELRSP